MPLRMHCTSIKLTFPQTIEDMTREEIEKAYHSLLQDDGRLRSNSIEQRKCNSAL
jgi:hypothetical protein